MTYRIAYMLSKNRKKVIVAMSGGVDSSVTAALLKKQGYDVAGVFIRFWAESKSAIENKCCSGEAEECARLVAAKLKIPFYIWHFEKEFKKAVVDYFLAEYQAGRTPNPCVVCNQKIKFGLFLKKALGVGADFIATGHYVRKNVILSPKGEESPAKVAVGDRMRGEYVRDAQTSCEILRFAQNDDAFFGLFAAADKTKDQSYFLYNLTQKELPRILFPLGDYKKSEVYQLARKWGLPYRKKESFDICFIASKSHNEFLKKYLKMKPGKIIATTPPHPSPYQGEGAKGGVLGQHQGLPLYTIGQKAEIGGPGPYYVVGFDRKKNNLVVTNEPDDPRLYKKTLIAEKVNWVSGQPPKLPLPRTTERHRRGPVVRGFKCLARIRYGHQAVPATVEIPPSPPFTKGGDEKGISPFGKGGLRGILKKEKYQVKFKTPQRAVTPGQSVVFYSKNGEVLGGGVIN